MKIDKLPSGNYRCRVYVGADENGKKHYKSFTAPTQKELRLLIAKFQSEDNMSEHEDVTLSELMKREVELAKVTKSNNTYRIYKGYMDRNFKWLQKTKIDKIDVNMIQKAILEEYNNGMAANYIKNATAFVLHCLNNADVHINTRKLRFPAAESKVYPTPTPEELNKIFDYLRDKDYTIYIMVRLAAMCSLRLGEIVGLIPSDYKDGYLHIQRSRDYTTHPTKTKSSNRYVPVPKDMQPFFNDLQGDNFIFPNCEMAYVTKIKRLMIKYGNPNITFHTFRHAFASNMVASGVPTKYIMDIGGWSSPAMINKIYAQTFNSEKENALAILEKYLESK